MRSSTERFEGCLLGLALGDALGAPFEGGLLERLLWRGIGRTRRGEMRWTDDTQMALDVCDAWLEIGHLDLDALAVRFARGRRWSRGYGPGTARVLARIARGEPWRQANRAVHRDGSMGNGAAMRSPAVALVCALRQEPVGRTAAEVASITHAHLDAIDGAVLVAKATAAAMNGADGAQLWATLDDCALGATMLRPFDLARQWHLQGDLPAPREVAARLGNGTLAVESVPTALHLAVRFLARDFEEMQQFAVAVGGDVDTIGAMAGAIWGAARGVAALPAGPLRRLEQRERIAATARALVERFA